MKNILSKGISILTILAMMFMSNVASATPNNEDNITICHATGSENNPWTQPTVDPNGLNGHGGHEDDIIPAYDTDNDQDIDDDDCNTISELEGDDDNDEDCEEGDDFIGGDNDCEDDDEEVCDSGINLLVNGGFEFPVVTNAANWSVYPDGTPGLGWDVAWHGIISGDTPMLEIHDSIWTPDEGTQYAELDTDHGNPPGGNTGGPSSVMISQDIVTIPGASYNLSYAFSPRPGQPAAENKLEVLVEGVLVQTQGPLAGGGDTIWTTHNYPFVATDALTTISFRDAGTPSDSLGTLLDDTKLNCTDLPEDEDITIVAEKIVCDDESDLPNYGDGGPNMTSTTATDWVASHEGCYLTEWDFEWAYYNTPNPGDNSEGPTGGDWNVFSGSVSMPMPSGTDNDTKLWVREVVEDGYIPFSGDVDGGNGWDEYSAEVYCHTDVLNYDNYDRIDGLVEGGTYNCVAWNVPEDTCEPVAGMPVYARVKLADQPYGWRNWNTGNIAPKIFVGGNVDMPNELAGNVYDPGEWFMIYDGLNYITDPDIAPYRDVPGIAVQRLAGSIRLVLYGSHPEPEGNPLFNRELATGAVQFSNDGIVNSLDAIAVSQTNDPENPWDFQPGNHQYHPGSDKTNLFTNLMGAVNSQFKFVATVGNDGFYTEYDHTPGTPCPGDDENPPLDQGGQ